MYLRTHRYDPEYMRFIQVGRVTLHIMQTFDPGDHEYFDEAEYTTLRNALNRPYKEDYAIVDTHDRLVHINRQRTANGERLWRDERGRIATCDEHESTGREYRYILVHTWEGAKLKHIFAIADSLNDYNNGRWWYNIVRATIEYNGRVIGQGFVTGIHSEATDSEILEAAREATNEALYEAHEFIDSIRKRA